MKRQTSIRIGSDEAGRPLPDYLAGRFTYRSKKEWQRELADGRLLLNGKVAAPDTILAAEDLLVYRMAELPEPPVDFNYRILHEDADLLVIDKPAPLPCHPGGRFFRHTLWARIRETHGPETPVFVHRLDRETSGVVVLAKSREAARRCQEQFAGQLVEKVYLVLVEGEFLAGETTAAGWLAPDQESVIRKKVCYLPEGSSVPAKAQSCRTTFRLLSQKNGLSLVEARPQSGRCHQIRATLCSLGFPVVGDKLYGVDEELFLRFMEERLSLEDSRRLRLPRQALHAASLYLRQPTSGTRLSFTAPLPEIFSEVFSISSLDRPDEIIVRGEPDR